MRLTDGMKGVGGFPGDGRSRYRVAAGRPGGAQVAEGHLSAENTARIQTGRRYA